MFRKGLFVGDPVLDWLRNLFYKFEIVVGGTYFCFNLVLFFVMIF